VCCFLFGSVRAVGLKRWWLQLRFDLYSTAIRRRTTIERPSNFIESYLQPSPELAVYSAVFLHQTPRRTGNQSYRILSNIRAANSVHLQLRLAERVATWRWQSEPPGTAGCRLLSVVPFNFKLRRRRPHQAWRYAIWRTPERNNIAPSNVISAAECIQILRRRVKRFTYDPTAALRHSRRYTV